MAYKEIDRNDEAGCEKRAEDASRNLFKLTMITFIAFAAAAAIFVILPSYS